MTLLHCFQPLQVPGRVTLLGQNEILSLPPPTSSLPRPFAVTPSTARHPCALRLSLAGCRGAPLPFPRVPTRAWCPGSTWRSPTYTYRHRDRVDRHRTALCGRVALTVTGPRGLLFCPLGSPSATRSLRRKAQQRPLDVRAQQRTGNPTAAPSTPSPPHPPAAPARGASGRGEHGPLTLKCFFFF